MSENTGWASSMRLGEVVRHRKEFIEIDDFSTYKRCRVQLHAKGILLRDKVEGSAIKTKKQQVCRPEEFLVAEIDAKMGGFGIVPAELEGAIVSSHYFLFEPIRERLDPRFLGYYCRTPAFRDQVNARGTTNYAAIRPAHVLDYTIPLPPLAEQRRIVAKIESLVEKIEKAQEINRVIAAKSIALLSSTIHCTLTRSTSDVSAAPLKQFIESHDSGWSPQCENYPAADGEWAVLKTTCVQWSGFDATANKALRTGMTPRPEICVRRGDVLITRAGPMNRVGVACVVQDDQEQLMLSDKIVRLRMTDAVEPAFVPLILASQQCQEYFRQGKTGLAASQVNISRAKLLDLPVVVPSRLIQQRIVETYSAVAVRVREADQRRLRVAERLQAILPSILDRAFQGEI